MGIHLFTVAQSKNLFLSSCTKNTKYCDCVTLLPVSSLVMVEKAGIMVSRETKYCIHIWSEEGIQTLQTTARDEGKLVTDAILDFWAVIKEVLGAQVNTEAWINFIYFLQRAEIRF